MKEKTFSDDQPHESHWKQQDLFSADLRWTWLLNSLFSSGIAAHLGANAVIVLLCLRSSANYQTGKVSLGQREICKQTGLSRGSVGTALVRLESEGLLSKEQRQKNRAVYSLADKIPFFRGHGDDKEKMGMITMPFVPLKRDLAINDARDFLREGRPKNGSPIQILYIGNMINNSATDGSVAIVNVANGSSSEVRLTPELRSMLERVLGGQT